jgi:Peptidase family M48
LAAVTTGRILRSRELLADAASVELTKDARALCSALLAVSNCDRLDSVDEATMALMISGPSGGWLATHPSVDKRIAALKAVAPELFPQLRGNRKFSDPALFGGGGRLGSLPVGAFGFANGSPSPTRNTNVTSARTFGRRITPPLAQHKNAWPDC